MEKEKKVVDFFVLCNKLKNIVRTGWLNWNIERDRVESVAEHIYSVQMLAIAMHSEYEYDINLAKVVMMLAVHELEEIYLGDIAITDPKYKELKMRGHEIVTEILSPLLNGDEIRTLIYEFDARVTPDAIFAYHCDKLECDIQAKLYDEEGCFDLSKQEGNLQYEKACSEFALQNKIPRFTDIWLGSDEHLYQDDENFMLVYRYVIDNKIRRFYE